MLPTQDVGEAIDKFSEVLKTLLPLPEGHSFTLVQNTEQINYIVIPVPPAELGIELSDDAELDLVVGGAVAVNVVEAVVINVNAVVAGAVVVAIA